MAETPIPEEENGGTPVAVAEKREEMTTPELPEDSARQPSKYPKAKRRLADAFTTPGSPEAGPADEDTESAVKKSLDEMACHMDDSSDEEDVRNRQFKQKPYQSFGIGAQWKRYKKDYFASRCTFDQKLQHKLAFIAHYLGMELLYSPAVETAYRSLKRDALHFELTPDMLAEATQAAVKHGIKDSLIYFVNDEGKHPEDSLVDELMTVLHLASKISSQIERCLQESENFSQLSTRLVESIFDKEFYANEVKFFSDHSYHWRPPRAMEELQAMPPPLLKLVQGFESESIETVLKALEPSLTDEGTLPNKSTRKLTVSDEHQKYYPQLIQTAWVILCSRQSGASARNILLKDGKQALSHAWVRDLIAMDGAVPESELTAETQVYEYAGEPHRSLLKDYLRLNPARFRYELKKIMQKRLGEGFKALFMGRRPTLGDCAEMKFSGGIIAWLANLRLLNRSFRRSFRNLSERALASSFFSGTHYKESTLYWIFGYRALGGVLETQKINAAGTRTTHVLSLGTYKDIGESIEIIKKKVTSLTDPDIAQLIRKILNGQDLVELENIKDPLVLAEVQSKLAGITYCLLGCEAVRNPSIIVLNQMMLDLIIAGKASWKSALSDASPLMPMSPEKSIARARALNSQFGPYSFFNYRYDEVDGKDADSLVQLTARLFIEWLEYHSGKKIQKLISGEIEKVIKNAMTDWYGLTGEKLFTFPLPAQEMVVRAP